MSQMSSSLKPWPATAAKSASEIVFASARHLHGEIEHRALARRDVGLAVVDGDLVGDQRDSWRGCAGSRRARSRNNGTDWRQRSRPRSSRARPWSGRRPCPSARRDRQRRRETRRDDRPASERRSGTKPDFSCTARMRVRMSSGSLSREARETFGNGLRHGGFRLGPRGGYAGTIVDGRAGAKRAGPRVEAAVSAAASSAARSDPDRAPATAAASARPAGWRARRAAR